MRTGSKGTRKVIKVWLVTWEHFGEHAEPDHEIAAIFNPRWSADRVREYVEFIYVNSTYSVSERIEYAINRNLCPYPAEFYKKDGEKWKGQIVCGDNPLLKARRVDIYADSIKPGNEGIKWEEHKMPDFPKI